MIIKNSRLRGTAVSDLFFFVCFCFLSSCTSFLFKSYPYNNVSKCLCQRLFLPFTFPVENLWVSQLGEKLSYSG